MPGPFPLACTLRAPLAPRLGHGVAASGGTLAFLAPTPPKNGSSEGREGHLHCRSLVFPPFLHVERHAQARVHSFLSVGTEVPSVPGTCFPLPVAPLPVVFTSLGAVAKFPRSERGRAAMGSGREGWSVRCVGLELSGKERVKS